MEIGEKKAMTSFKKASRHSHDFARADVERDVIERDEAAEPPRDVADLDH